jgi:ribosomal protein L27
MSPGIQDDYRQPGSREFQRNALGQKLGALVGAHHTIERNGAIFVAFSVKRHSDAPHGAGVDHAIHARIAGRLQYVARAIYVRAIQLALVGRP